MTCGFENGRDRVDLTAFAPWAFTASHAGPPETLTCSRQLAELRMRSAVSAFQARQGASRAAP
jgi:hypothetical protein